MINLTSDRMLKLLGEFQRSGSIHSLYDTLDRILRQLLDVDVVTISTHDRSEAATADTLRSRNRNRAVSMGHRRELARKGITVEECHPPAIIECDQEGVHIGSIHVWRYTSRDPITDRTAGIMEELEPFVRFAVTAIAARERLLVYDDGFEQSLRNFATVHDLTGQERRVLMFLVLGHSQSEVARLLGISLNTLKKHCNALYRKAGVAGLSPLIGAFFGTRRRT